MRTEHDDVNNMPKLKNAVMINADTFMALVFKFTLQRKVKANHQVEILRKFKSWGGEIGLELK
jgi:hypothetical protein